MHPGQHRVLDGRRQLAAADREHLCHEEGVAARLAVESVGSTPVPAAIAATAAAENSRDLDAPYGRLGGDVAEHDADRVGRLQLLTPVGDDDQRRRPHHASREETDQVEGRAVGPVQVLEHEDGRPTRYQRVQRRLEQPVALARAQQLPDAGVEVGRDVDQGSQGPGRGQRVTCPPEHPAAGLGSGVGPLADEGRLARACLALDQEQPARAGERLVEDTRHRLDEVGSLRERHRLSVDLTRRRLQERRDRGGLEGAVLVPDESLELTQLWPGLDALAQGRAGAAVGGEGVHRASGPVLRRHQQRPERLPGGVPAHQRLELGQRRRHVGTSQVGRDAALEGVEAQRRQPLGLLNQRGAVGELHVRRTSPQRQGGAEHRARLDGTALEERPAAEGQLPLEHPRVHVAGGDVEHVALPPGPQQLGRRQVTAQPADSGTERAFGGRRAIAPQAGGQPVRTDLAAGREREQRQQTSGQQHADLDRVAAVTDLERPPGPRSPCDDGRGTGPAHIRVETRHWRSGQDSVRVRKDAVPAASTAEMDGGTVRAAARRWARVTTVARDDSRIAHIAASRSSAAQSAAE